MEREIRSRPQKLRDSFNEWNGIKIMVLVIMSITTINIVMNNDLEIQSVYSHCGDTEWSQIAIHRVAEMQRE